VLMLLRLAQALEILAACLLVRLDPRAPRAPTAPGPALAAQGAWAPGGRPEAKPAQQPGDPDALLALLGVSLRRARRQLHLSQTTLATMTGLSPTYIGEIEQGQRSLSVLSLLRLAEALELPVAHLLAPLEPHQRPSPPCLP
jgi:DNA-binding XRE family transcriptional regulator